MFVEAKHQCQHRPTNELDARSPPSVLVVRSNGRVSLCISSPVLLLCRQQAAGSRRLREGLGHTLAIGQFLTVLAVALLLVAAPEKSSSMHIIHNLHACTWVTVCTTLCSFHKLGARIQCCTTRKAFSVCVSMYR